LLKVNRLRQKEFEKYDNMTKEEKSVDQ